MFWFFDRLAYRALAPRSGIKAAPPGLELKVLTTEPPGKSLSHCFNYCSFVVLLEVWEGYASCFILFLQDCFPDLVPCKFWIICSSSVKNAMGNLIGITLNLQIALGSMSILTILLLLTQEHGHLHFFESSSISCINVLYFSAYKSFTSLETVIPKYFILGGTI